MSRVIRWLTRSDYSHVAVVLNDGRVVEAWDSGVRIVDSLSDQHTPGTTVDLFEFDPPLTQGQEAAGERYLLGRIGKRYDWTGVFRFVTRRRGSDANRDFCSELLDQTVQAMELTLFRQTQSWEIPPGWVPRSLALKFVRREVTRWTNFHKGTAAALLLLLACGTMQAQDNTDLMYRVVRAPNRPKARALLGITNLQSGSINLSNWSVLDTNVLTGLGGGPTSGVSVAVSGSILGARTNGSLVTISNKVEMNPGTVTSITGGYGLTGGTITSSGALGVNSNTIPSFTQMTNWLAGLQQTNTVTLSNVMTVTLDHSRTNTWKYPADPQDVPGIPGGSAEWDTNYTVATVVADGSLYTLDYYSQMQWGNEGGSFDAAFEAHLFYTDNYGGRTNTLWYASSSGGDYDYTKNAYPETSNQYAWQGSVVFQPVTGSTIVLSNRWVNSLDSGSLDTRATNIERFVIYARTNQTFTYRGLVWPP